MAFSTGYTFGFAAAICLVCSVGVSGAAVALKERQDLNKERDLRSSILGALKVFEPGQEPDGEQIDALWEERVEVVVITPDGKKVEDGGQHDLDGDGDVDIDDVTLARQAAKGEGTPPILAVYRRLDDGKTGAIGIPVFGKGLWGPISGYLALDPQGREVVGTTFFAPKETPGLGAEIQEPSFEDQWVGKKVVNKGKTVPIRVAKGDAESLYPSEAEHWVDGVSGATITSRGVSDMVVEGMALYDPFLSRIRK